MVQFIPDFIIDRYQQGEKDGQIEAATLFVDISGFTSLTETLLNHDTDGAEILSHTLNMIFGSLVEIVYQNGGFVTTFAGDAFTAVYPLASLADDAPKRAVRSAFAMQAFLQTHGEQVTRYGTFTFMAKIGIGFGPVEWGLVGSDAYKTFYFDGAGVQDCLRAEQHAGRGEIIASTALQPHIADYTSGTSRAEMTVLTEQRVTLDDQPLVPPQDNHSVARDFILDAVLDLTVSGEFREIANVFISFDPADRAALDQFTTQIMTLCNQYGGYFRHLDIGDKGPVIVVLFGAPTTYENNTQRAAEFALALKNTVSNIRWSVGLTFGTVYAGMIGGDQRADYAAVGDVVNLAARIMSKTPANAVWVSGQAVQQLMGDFALLPQGEQRFKGKTGVVGVWSLENRKQGKSDERFRSNDLVGREETLTTLATYLEPLKQRKFGGVVEIHGEAGLGKSRLVYELRMQNPRLNWMIWPTDEVLRQGLNPIRSFLRQYFEQGNDESTNKFNFEDSIEALLADGRINEDLRNELRRTQSFLGAVIDLHWPGSLYEQVDPALRAENTITAITTLIHAECLRRPVVIHIEDVHWLDGETPAVLRELTKTRDDQQYPLLLLFTSRYADDGSRIAMPITEGVPQQVIELSLLDAAGIKQVAQQVLRGDIDDSLLTLLVNRANGNPFFVEQLALDLRERDLLKQTTAGLAVDANAVSGVPTNINAVVIARIDRLTAQVRNLVQTAAVLGQEFEVNVLVAMLNDKKLVETGMRQAADFSIWQMLTEVRYLFQHALLRDAAYEMQLRARRRNLHALAADAIAELHTADLSPYYGDLAHHNRMAERDHEELTYTMLAGEQAARRYANDEAIAHFTRAAEIATDDAATYKALYARAEIYATLGMSDESKADIDRMLGLVLDDEQRAEALLLKTKYLHKTTQIDDAVKTALEVVKIAEANDWFNLQGRALNEAGHASVTAGRLEAGREYLDAAVALAEAHNLPTLLATASSNYGGLLLQSGDYNDALLMLTQAAEKHGELGNRREKLNTITNRSNVEYSIGQHAQAKVGYKQTLAGFTEIGDLHGQTVAMLGLGATTLAMDRDHETARGLFFDAMRLTQKSGNIRLKEILLGNLGLLSAYLGDLTQAVEYAKRAVKIAEELGNPQRIMFACGSLAYAHYRLGDYAQAMSYAQRIMNDASEVGMQALQQLASTLLGHINAAQGNSDEAMQHYQQSIDLATSVGETHLIPEPLAGIMRLLLETDTDKEKLSSVANELADKIDANPDLSGNSDELLIYLTVHKALKVLNDPRAETILQQAHERYQSALERIRDERLQAMFAAVDYHQEIITLMQDQQSS